jgi:hypothetical protein
LSNNAEVESSSGITSKHEERTEKPRAQKPKENEGEQLVMGLGPVQTSFWRLAKLVPLEGFRRQYNKYNGKQVHPIEATSAANSARPSIENVAEPQSLEIQEGSDGISLKPLSDSNNGLTNEAMTGKVAEKTNAKSENKRNWNRVPYLPSYVPFGQVIT